MVIKVLFFGQLLDVVGTDQLILDQVGDTVQLRQILLERYPALASIPFTMALDHRFVAEEQVFLSDSTVACMPPFSGG